MASASVVSVAVPAAQTMGDTSSLQSPPPMQSPFSLLFVGANVDPASDRRAQLKLKEECKIMREALQSGFGEDAWRGKVGFCADCCADPASFMNDVMIIGPGILQFSCQGEIRGLWFSHGLTEASDIVDELKAHNKAVEAEGGQRIRLVVVNACMSGPLAMALCESVDFVIGHSHSKVSDNDALSFSRTLYRALGRGRSLDASFKAANISNRFNLYARNFNPEQFLLPVPGPTASQSQVSGRLIGTGLDTETSSIFPVIDFLKKNGLIHIAKRLSDRLYIEHVSQLRYVKPERLDRFAWLEDTPKGTLLDLCRVITQQDGGSGRASHRSEFLWKLIIRSAKTRDFSATRFFCEQSHFHGIDYFWKHQTSNSRLRP